MPIRVNGREISERAINQESAAFAGRDPKDAQRQAAVALIIRELLLEQVAQARLVREQGEAAVDAAIDALLIREVVTPDPDDNACRQYYLANPERFRSPTLVAARHIPLAAHPEDLEEREQARTQAETLIGLLATQPERFAELARACSACPSKAQGGQLGQLSRGQTVSEFEDVLLRLPVGLATRPVLSRYGYHVVEVLEKLEGQPLPFDAVLPTIREYLATKTRRRAISQYLQRLVGSAEIKGIELAGAAAPLVQ